MKTTTKKEPSNKAIYNYEDKIGNVFYLKDVKKTKQGIRRCKFRCYCGKTFETNMVNIKHRKTKSCGCLNTKRRTESLTTHGLSYRILFDVWRAIIDRCTIDKSLAFDYYGGRGISICDEWLNSYELFEKWSLENGYKKGLEIDRINNDGNYEPSNCRYVSRSVNTSNTRKIRSNNTSGYRGVGFRKDTKRFYAKITVEKKVNNLGCFDNPKEAAEAYDNFIKINNLPHTRNFDG